MTRDSVDKPSNAKATLYLPSGFGRGGFVMLSFGEPHVVAEYGPAKVELLLALNRALMEDETLTPAARGWRSPQWISSLLLYSVEEGSLRRSVSIINRKFREAAQQAHPHLNLPPLLQTKRGVGIRLSWNLQVIVAEMPRPNDK